MTRQKATVSKAELERIGEVLAVFMRLPELDQVAFEYYIKGRIDAQIGGIDIPVRVKVEVAAV